ncbi:hypothetical protein C0Z18_01500 [Trinickia dabaoshanensis]|uniref:Uncharacterized protein n=1 Tax=Trinickia dabaoshanensis TaxID=564714 RepID=A0A2N7W384_9BURK|nr:hypothetical protein C0Z18_01500 [Trinickia dabaoshanensis]
MSISDQVETKLPKEFEEWIPSVEQILRALGRRTYAYAPDTEFVRASHDARYVKTASPFQAHRFGPPLEFVRADGTLEFNWLYTVRVPSQAPIQGSPRKHHPVTVFR